MTLHGRTETRSTRRAAAHRDAVSVLTADHRAVKRLFEAYKDLGAGRAKRATKSEKAELVQRICLELTVHAQIEEEMFYPAARKAIKDDELVDEAEVEHASIKELVGQLQGMDPGDELYDAKVRVLGEYVDHHVSQEEKKIFPLVRKTKLDLEMLGGQLSERKMALTDKLSSRARHH